MNSRMLGPAGSFHRIATFVLLASCLIARPTIAAENAIDWNRAQELHQKAQRGGTLTDEERAYLQRATAARREKKGASADTVALTPRDTTGLVPLPEMSATDNYKGRDGGLYGGGRNEPPPALQRAALAEA